MTEYLIFASNFNRWAGPNTPLLDVCNYLCRNLDFDFTLVTHNADFHDDFSTWIKFPVLPVLDGGSSNPVTRLACVPANTRLIQKIIRSLKVPKERVFVNASLDTLFETRFATGSRVPTGYNVLSSGLNPFYNTLDRLAARTSIMKILAHTNYHKNLYMKVGIEEQRIRVIPHCVDVDRIERMSRNSQEGQENGPTIFFGGRLTPEKGVIELLDSYQQVSETTDSKLILLGRGPLEHWILARRSKIAKRCVREGVVCLGWQPPNVFLRRMCESDIVIVPSHEEAFCITLLEAMALSKPVVATSVGGIPEIVTNHYNGMLVAPRDSDQLAEVIGELLNDARLRANLGSNAFKTVKEKYDVSRVAPKFVNFMSDPD